MASDSESDNEAPEEITLATSRQAVRSSARKDQAIDSQLAQAKKAKNRALEAKSKLTAKGKAKAKAQQVEEAAAAAQAEVEEQANEEEDEESEAEQEDVTFDDDEEVVQLGDQGETPAATSSKQLDPSVFASAATFFTAEAEANAPTPGGMGKHKMKRMIRAQKNARAAVAAAKAAQVGEGGSRQVDGRTVQHLPGLSAAAPNLSSTTIRPSHSTAAKFVTNRLYSKKRVLAVLDAGKPRDDTPEHKKKKGMSDESKILLGMPVEAKGKEGPGSSKSDKKRSLLLQAEGRRVKSAQRLGGSRGGVARPARDFAQSTK